jgi:hypothetical protein
MLYCYLRFVYVYDDILYQQFQYFTLFFEAERIQLLRDILPKFSKLLN